MTNEKISTVIIDHNDTQKLEDALRAHLSAPDEQMQSETIIVVDKGKKESEELLERMKPQFPDIHITFVPDSSRRMSDQKIAVLLGVKAASNDRIELIDTIHHEFSTYRQFACMQLHRSLAKRHGGFDLEMGNSSLTLSKSKFLQRESFEDNINAISTCYEPAKGHLARRLWTGVKYVLYKCRLYPG